MCDDEVDANAVLRSLDRQLFKVLRKTQRIALDAPAEKDGRLVAPALLNRVCAVVSVVSKLYSDYPFMAHRIPITHRLWRLLMRLSTARSLSAQWMKR